MSNLITRIKTDFEFSDDRGTLVQLCRRGYSQVNVVTTHAGVIRGGHCHRLNTEAFYVISGKCLVTARKNGEEEKEVFTAGEFFRIEPFAIHEFEYLEDTVMVTMYSLGVEFDDGTKDMYTE